jgi:hypothetical protein
VNGEKDEKIKYGMKATINLEKAVLARLSRDTGRFDKTS